MPGDGESRFSGAPGRIAEGGWKMGALIWFLFVAVVTLVLERETFFS